MEIMGRDYVTPKGVKIACIGPVTAAAVKNAGLPADIIQERYTIPGLVETLTKYFSENSMNDRKRRSRINHVFSCLPTAAVEKKRKFPEDDHGRRSCPSIISFILFLRPSERM